MFKNFKIIDATPEKCPGLSTPHNLSPNFPISKDRDESANFFFWQKN